MKKLLGLLLALCMLLSGVAFAETAEAPALQQELVVLFTSDVHCGVDTGFGYAGLAAVRDNLKAQGKHVVLVDNGDSIQGAPIGTMTKGEANIKLMNAVGYDVATIGNHEFDYGMERFHELVAMAEFPYVSCNFVKNGEPVFAPYIIKEFDGVKVAFLGISTPKTITSSAPKYFQDENGNFIYGFCQDETGAALYAAVQTAIDAAKGEGAQYVIGLAHLGNEAECQPWTYADVIANTTGMDALLDGHSHDTNQVEMLNKDGNTVLRSACGTKLEGIGYLTIGTNGAMETGIYMWGNDVAAPELFGIENDAATAVKAATDELDAKLKEVVAKTSVDLLIEDPVAVDENGKPIRIIRNAETNLGDLCADAYRAMSGADVAIVNGGGIRKTIKAGDITLNDILLVHPYSNSMCMIEVTGQEILDALEFSVRSMPGEFGGFLQVSGMTFEIHTYIESPVEMDEAKMFVGVKEGAPRRIQNVLVGGEPIDPAKTYTLASHNYKIKDMGDGYTHFADNKIILDEVMVDNQVLMTYITDVLGGVVGAEYAEPYGQGRIVAVPEAPAAE
ncbi:MAG: bifunctional metallophosphatase/5'-nucleotidase [Clostridiales bacterium]|nr:bifunctional metallophosphatase/5'-nucleotidase [Clostridiales bacterium]